MSRKHLIVRDRDARRGLITLKSRSRPTASDIERERRSTRSRGTPSLPRMGATDTASHLNMMNDTKHA